MLELPYIVLPFPLYYLTEHYPDDLGPIAEDFDLLVLDTHSYSPLDFHPYKKLG